MAAESELSQPSSDDEPHATAARGRALGRWQFSLRELLLFVLLVAMALSLFVTGRRFLRAEAELAEYRREYGILKVENPTMLHAVARWTPEPGQWRWRVHFPPGRYDLCWRTAGIPAEGLPIPKPQRGLTADLAGFGDVSVVAYKDPRDNVWKYAITVGGVAGGGSFTNTTYTTMPVNLPNELGSSTSGVQWGQDPVIVSPQEPLVLLRKRLATKKKNGSISVTTVELADGLMLWIRRVGKASGQGSVMW